MQYISLKPCLLSDYRSHPSRSQSSLLLWCPHSLRLPARPALLCAAFHSKLVSEWVSECTHTFIYTHLYIQSLNTLYCNYLYSCVSHFNFYLSVLLSLHQLTHTHTPLNKCWWIHVRILSHSNPGKTFFTIVNPLTSFKSLIEYQNEAYFDHFI